MIRERAILLNNMRTVRVEPQAITAAALKQLQAIYPVQVTNLRSNGRGRAGAGWDGEVTLKTDRGTVNYLFEVKTHLRPQTIQQILIHANVAHKQHGKHKGFLLLADYVNPALGHQLKHAGINYIDTVGNLYLKQEPGLHLYVEGKRLQVPMKDKPARLFQPSGLTLLFGLLVKPESLNWPYRDLAQANNVALGTVGWIMRDLREHGYVEPIGKGRFHLIRKKELLDRWVEGYTTRLRPKIIAGEFVEPTRDLDSVVEAFENYALEQQILWGLTGGFGAFELLHHYRGLTLSIFVEKWATDTALVALHLLPQEGGDVRVLKSFSPGVFTKLDRDTGYPVVHPLLVYAELLYQNGDRELETARLIYTQFLEPSIDSD